MLVVLVWSCLCIIIIICLMPVIVGDCDAWQCLEFIANCEKLPIVALSFTRLALYESNWCVTLLLNCYICLHQYIELDDAEYRQQQ